MMRTPLFLTLFLYYQLAPPVYAWIAPTSSTTFLPAKYRANSRTRLNVVANSNKISRGLKRVKDSVTSQERSREDLKIGIAGFYDRSSKLWEEVWGEQ